MELWWAPQRHFPDSSWIRKGACCSDFILMWIWVGTATRCTGILGGPLLVFCPLSQVPRPLPLVNSERKLLSCRIHKNSFPGLPSVWHCLQGTSSLALHFACCATVSSSGLGAALSVHTRCVPSGGSHHMGRDRLMAKCGPLAAVTDVYIGTMGITEGIDRQ